MARRAVAPRDPSPICAAARFNSQRPAGRPVVVCGVDDAGRGSMIGPLVIAGVAVKRGGIGRLREIGVRDSKALSPARREELYGRITGAAHCWHASRIGPSTIDRSVARHRLNALEAAYMARVISRLGAGTAYVDACDVDAGRFGRTVSSMVRGRGRGCTVHSHHRADSRFEVVAAASIVAKVVRDREVARIARRHGGRDVVGSGYPSDGRTVRFVEKWIAESGGTAPPFARSSWKPVRAMLMDAMWDEWSGAGEGAGEAGAPG